MSSDPQIRAVVLAQRLTRLHLVFSRCVHELTGVVADIGPAALKGSQIANVLGSHTADPAALFHRPIVDLSAMTVTWAGRSCTLRSTRHLRLMDRLARRPGHYIPVDRLIRDVWDGKPLTDDTVRSTIRSLKVRLRQARMSRLARCIKCAEGRYGLALDRTN